MAELFDLSTRRNEDIEVTAERLAERLSLAIAEVGSSFGDNIALSTSRVDKSRRAQVKALNALQNNDFKEAIDHARRGLLHLELARSHSYTSREDLHQPSMPAPVFDPGSAEQAIQTLSEAICNIKLLAEYRKISLNKSLAARLAEAVEELQEAIETYAQGGRQIKSAQILSECGLVWCQFIYGQLNGDQLVLPESKNKSLRALLQFSRKVSIEVFNAVPFLVRVKNARHHVRAIEHNLALALNAYLDEDDDEVDKFIRLGSIEAAALIRYKAQSDIVDDNEKTNFNLDSLETSTLSENLTETAGHLGKYQPLPQRALRLFEKMQTDLVSLKKLMKAREWPQAEILVKACQVDAGEIEEAIRKLDI